MTVNSKTWTSKSAVGAPQVGANFNYTENSENPNFAIGFKVETQEGKVFRYTHFGAAVTQGKLVSQDISETSVVTGDATVVEPSSAQTTTDGTIGSKYIEVTLASVTANQFSGATLVVASGSGQANVYDIVGNTATNDPASGNIRIQLKQAIVGDANDDDLSANSDLLILGNKWNNVETATTTDNTIAGVSITNMTASYYGWVQTKGPASVLTSGTVSSNDAVQLSQSVSGAIEAFGGANTSDSAAELQEAAIIGICQNPGGDTDYSIIDLMID